MDGATADAIQWVAITASVKAGVVKPCVFHPLTILHQGDLAADRRAFVFAIHDMTEGKFDCSPQKMVETVKAVLDEAPIECPKCEWMRRGVDI